MPYPSGWGPRTNFRTSARGKEFVASPDASHAFLGFTNEARYRGEAVKAPPTPAPGVYVPLRHGYTKPRPIPPLQRGVA